MPRPTTIVDDRPRDLGRPIEAEIARRRSAALAATSGLVLDLADPSGRRVLADSIDGDDAHLGNFDAVLTFAELIRFPDLAASLLAIDALLAPGGAIEAFEPIARPGLLGMFARSAFTILPSIAGFHIGRDLLAATRTTSLSVDDVERVRFATPIVPIRHFVALRARRAVVILPPTDQEVAR